MNTRQDNIRHFLKRMASHIIRDAEAGGLGRPLWSIARQYIGYLGMSPVDAARVMRYLGMGKKSIRSAIAPCRASSLPNARCVACFAKHAEWCVV